MGDLDIHIRRLLRALPRQIMQLTFPDQDIEPLGLPVDPSVDRSRKLTADNLIRVRHRGTERVMHVEVERDWRPSIPRRLFEYGVAAMTETQLPVSSITILLQPGGDPPVGVGTYRVEDIEGDIVVFRYRVVPLWQLDVEEQRAALGPQGLPFCLAMRGADEALAGRFAQEVRTAPGLSPEERQHTLELLCLVAAAIFGSAAANRIFHMESLIQDPNVQEFIRGWTASGELEKARSLLYRVLAARAMPVPPEVRERIDAEQDVNRLEAWHDAAVTAGSIEDVLSAG